MKLAALVLFAVMASAIAQPQVTGTHPPEITSSEARQSITIVGTGFAPASVVTLEWGDREFIIPAERTTYVDSTSIRILAGIFPPDATWTARVTNPDGTVSNRYQLLFSIAGALPASTPATASPPAPRSNPTQDDVTDCLFLQHGDCTVRIETWTVEVRNDSVEGRRVTVSGRPSSVASIFGGSSAGDLVFSCRNERFSIYVRTTSSLLQNSSVRVVWKFGNGATHDMQLWNATYGFAFTPLFVPSALQEVFLAEARRATGGLTIRAWFFYDQDTIYSTEGLPDALQAIHCR